MNTKKQVGFTLIELLVVIFCVAIFSAVGLGIYSIATHDWDKSDTIVYLEGGCNLTAEQAENFYDENRSVAIVMASRAHENSCPSTGVGVDIVEKMNDD